MSVNADPLTSLRAASAVGSFNVRQLQEVEHDIAAHSYV